MLALQVVVFKTFDILIYASVVFCYASSSVFVRVVIFTIVMSFIRQATLFAWTKAAGDLESRIPDGEPSPPGGDTGPG